MGRYAYEIHRNQFGEGFVTADSPEEAKAKLLEDLYDLDWDSDAPEIDVFSYDHDA